MGGAGGGLKGVEIVSIFSVSGQCDAKASGTCLQQRELKGGAPPAALSEAATLLDLSADRGVVGCGAGAGEGGGRRHN